MKLHRHIKSGILPAVLLLAGSAQIQATPNFTVAAFATGTQGENNSQDGTYGQYNGDNLSVPYGAGTIAWDGITFDAAAGSTGSAHITANFSSANNADVLVSMAPGYNNWYYEGASGTCPTGTVNFTQYSAVQFDILWDTNSTLTISQFNTGDGWPVSDFTNSSVGSNYMATNSYYTAGVNVELFTGSGGNTVYLGTFQVPSNAATGWQTVTVPYSDSLAGITSGAGIWFQGSFGGGSELSGNSTAAFWIDNLILVGNVTVAAPPTLLIPTKAAPGLAIFNAAEGTGNNYYDRNEVIAKTTNGLSWVGHTPASYSFNMAGFPNGTAYTGEAYLILVPNSGAEDVAADYNEAAAMILEVQSTSAGGQASLSYKVALPASETYTTVPFTSFTGPSAPATVPGNSVPSAQLLGNYTLTFTGNDAGTVTTPDGTSGTFSLPTNLAETYFTEGVAEPVPTNSAAQADTYNFLMYLGGQANDASFIDRAVVYQSITVTGPPNGSQVSENFVNDANSGLALQDWQSSWTGGSTTSPAANVLVPTNAPYWIDWSLPAVGFVLVDSSSLGTNAKWINVSTYAPIAMYQSNAQLISVHDLNSTNAEFFALIDRTFSQLLILLPGQTFTPGSAPGYSGTPTQVNGGSSGFAEENVTVLAVDSSFNLVTSVTDTITLSSTDGGATLPNPEAMVNGSVTFNTANSAFYFGDDGTFTITAQDTTSTNIPSATSAPVVVAN